MPKIRTRKLYYRNRQPRQEFQQLGRQYHGLYRTWHYNGQIAEELHYHHGRLNGVCRQWDEKGNLLGSFTMKHGTGTQRYWHGNGLLKMEIDSIDGKFHGRSRSWLPDGTLVQEIYTVQNHDVTRTAYLKASRKNPDWPQYTGEPAGVVARENAAFKRRQHELFTETLLAKAHAEAREWLGSANKPDFRSLAKFRTAKSALRFVEALYAAGADAVVAGPIYAGKHGKLFADWLLVKLPVMPSRRRTLRKLCRIFCNQRGGAILPDRDLGEKYLYLLLE